MDLKRERIKKLKEVREKESANLAEQNQRTSEERLKYLMSQVGVAGSLTHLAACFGPCCTI